MDVSPKQVTDSSIASIADEECPLVKDSAKSSQAKGLFHKSGSDASLPFTSISFTMPSAQARRNHSLLSAAVVVRLAQAIA